MSVSLSARVVRICVFVFACARTCAFACDCDCESECEGCDDGGVHVAVCECGV